jgi:alpha-beta hydrolase superfamily lysophospholipase
MESESPRYEDLFIPTHDARLLVLRRFNGGGKRAVLIVPGMQRRISERWYDDLASSLRDESTTTYLLELRGHGLSEGKFSLDQHRKDLELVLGLLRKRFKKIFTISHDLSASVLLSHEHNLDGMILIEPSLEHKKEQFRLTPVRVQTHTVIFSSNTEVLKKVFGPTLLRNWDHHFESSAGHAAGIKAIIEAVHHLYKQETPIRFKV